MKNVDVLKKILMSEAEYWVIAKQDYVMRWGCKESLEDIIILIAIPSKVRRGLKYEDITLKDLEDLRDSYIEQNIYLNRDYSPFQSGLSWYDIYDVFPLVDIPIKGFLTQALSLNSKYLHEYKKLAEKLSEAAKETSTLSEQLN